MTFPDGSHHAPDEEDAVTDVPPDDTTEPGDDDEASKEVVEHERAEIREFVKTLSGDDIRSGNWFEQLLTQALSTYTAKVDWQYFQDKYAGVPADAIVDQRIKMAARYAAIEGGLSAGAYTAAVAATIGSLGGAGPATVPAAVATMMIDVVYVTRLQVRLAYDIAVLYRVPIDTSDPEDLWKLIRVAFTIKSGEFAREGVIKIVPALMRPLIKKYFTGSVRVAAQSLPVIGQKLLVRNVIKVGIPVVGVPLAVVINRYSTLVAGRHARAVFRNEARIIELAGALTSRTTHPQLLLWVAWLVITCDKKIADDEALLMRHLVRLTHEQHEIRDEELADVVEIDPNDVWDRIAAEPDDLDDIVDAATRVAEVDGDVNSREKAVLAELRERCARS